VTARAIGGDALFRDDLDRRVFLAQFARAATSSRWSCHAYCLMTTHYHLLVETSQKALSRGMHRLNGCYAQSFNARHGRKGHLFEERFSAYLVEGDRYVEQASRYILENPVRAGMCERIDLWPWSGRLLLTGTVP
jgi:putative transposase